MGRCGEEGGEVGVAGGRVVAIGSEAGATGLPIGVSTYGAAQAGAAGFIRHLALEPAGQGVTANTIALGLVADGQPEPPESAALASTIPVRRIGSPDDAGALTVYLVSEEASWITGQTINLNGGTLMA
ncbi:SDR family oxidoreductase [Embleya sp. NPDC008237]|uniref:SDR family oxidoreductase n=1 Tax=Embleya sp. NPDC008237 TaxID=3363978 RepID=UPI0036E9C1E0